MFHLSSEVTVVTGSVNGWTSLHHGNSAMVSKWLQQNLGATLIFGAQV